MISEQIRPGLWYIGAVEEGLRTFGKASFTEAGAMYNSYLMDAGNGYILFGTLPERYVSDWLGQIMHITAQKPIGWVVLFGTASDRSCLDGLLQIWPEAAVIGGANALYRLDGFVERKFARVEVRSHRSLTLGSRTLRFQVIPDKFDTPSVYVLEQRERILLTADAFGSVFASDRILASRVEDKKAYFDGVRRYFSEISGEKRSKSLLQAAAFTRDSGVQLVCPAQGPVADYDLERLYSVFTPQQEEKEAAPVLGIFYEPGHYVGELAKRIEAGVLESGNIRVEMVDLSAMNRENALQKASRCDAFLFGTPQVRQDAAKAVWDMVTSVDRESCQGKLAAVFTSGESESDAAQNLRQRLAMLGCDLTLQDFSVKGKPDPATLKNAYEYGYGVGCSIQKIPNPRKPKLVKCLVCGEIFDASLGTCPVCGVGLEQCVPADEEDVLFKKNTQNRYVIMGGGVAAVSAAEAIRRRDETGRILMFSAETCLPINRPMLTKDLVTVAQMPDTMFIHGKQWYDDQRIELYTGCGITALDTQRKTVTIATGETICYDKLIYAAGAECFVPPFEGHEKTGVLTIRHLTDSLTLEALMKTAKNAVVIGGGVLGLEAASELMRSGLSVTVLEATPQIIGRQVDGATAARLKQIMAAMHVECFEGVSIAGIEGEERATGVRLADGRVFPADLVIVSCGNRANVQAAKAAGIQVDRSIVVNQRMETSAADVYACGDCAQFDGVNYQLWQEASNQGRVAGANAAGEPLVYANQPLGLSLEGFGTSLFAMGDPGKRTDIPYKTVQLSDDVTGSQEKYWFYGGSLQGAVLIGAPSKVADITHAVTVHAEHDELF